MFPELAAQRRTSVVPLKSAAALAVLLVAGGALLWRAQATQSAATAYLTAPVTRGDVATTVSATGPVSAITSVPLTFKNGGRLAQALVQQGDRVQTGQALARQDDADPQAQVAQAQATLAQAQAALSGALARLEQTKAGSRPEDVRAAEAQLEAAQVRLAQAEAFAGGPEVVAARSQLDAAKSKLAQLLSGGRPEDVAAAQAQVDAAGAKLQQLLNPRPEDVAAAQSQLEAARSKLDQLLNARPEDVRSAEAGIAAARARLQALANPRPEDFVAAQAAVDQAKTKLAQLVDLPKTAKPEEIANAELAVRKAEAALDKARADATNVRLSKTASEADKQAAEAVVQQAQIAVVAAQNDLSKLRAQGPSEWDVRMAQEALNQAQANLDKIKNPSPADVQAAQAALDQAQAQADKITNPSPYDVQTARAAVTQAQANLDKLQNPSPADVQAAQQAVAQAQANLDRLRRPSDFDVHQAQDAVTQAQANLDKLLSGNAYDLQSTAAALKQTQANLDLKNAGPTAYDVASAMAAVDQAQAQVDAARAALQLAQANLAAATLVAPIDGTVAQINYAPGQFVPGGAAGTSTSTASNTSATAFMVLTDLDNLQVVAQVNEADIGKVKVGNHVDFSVGAYPGQTFTGRVAAIQPLGTMDQNVVTYGVTCALDSAPAAAGQLLPGMTANVTIATERRTDAVLMPAAALSFAQNQGATLPAGASGAAGGPNAPNAVVLVPEGGKTVPRPIRVGMSDGQSTEVLSGIAPGQQVIVGTRGQEKTG